MEAPDITLIEAFDQTPWGRLEKEIDWQQRSVVVYGQTYPQPRLTRWYGPVPYLYSGLRWEADPMPPWLAEIAARAERIAAAPFNSVLCNLYRDGQDTVGWHSDDEPLFGCDPVVASISFGATREFKLRLAKNSKKVVSYALKDGDLLVMGKGVQTTWKHSIPRTAKPVGPRINLTFRCVV